MSAVPRCSVVIPIRNRAGVRLDNCLRSLGWQEGVEGGGIEVVLSDFGSDADTLAEVEAAGERFGARVVHRATDEVWNRSRALNIGVRAAAGEVILCSDVDMVFAPDFVATALDELAQRDGRAFVLCRCWDLPEETAGDRIGREDFEAYRARCTMRPSTGMGGCQATLGGWFRDVRGYDEAFKWWGWEDQDMAGRAARSGLELVWMTERTGMLHQWHPKWRLDSSRLDLLRVKLNRLRCHALRPVVRRNWFGWG